MTRLYTVTKLPEWQLADLRFKETRYKTYYFDMKVLCSERKFDARTHNTRMFYTLIAMAKCAVPGLVHVCALCNKQVGVFHRIFDQLYHVRVQELKIANNGFILYQMLVLLRNTVLKFVCIKCSDHALKTKLECKAVASVTTS